MGSETTTNSQENTNEPQVVATAAEEASTTVQQSKSKYVVQEYLQTMLKTGENLKTATEELGKFSGFFDSSEQSSEVQGYIKASSALKTIPLLIHFLNQIAPIYASIAFNTSFNIENFSLSADLQESLQSNEKNIIVADMEQGLVKEQQQILDVLVTTFQQTQYTLLTAYLLINMAFAVFQEENKQNEEGASITSDLPDNIKKQHQAVIDCLSPLFQRTTKLPLLLKSAKEALGKNQPQPTALIGKIKAFEQQITQFMILLNNESDTYKMYLPLIPNDLQGTTVQGIAEILFEKTRRAMKRHSSVDEPIRNSSGSSTKEDQLIAELRKKLKIEDDECNANRHPHPGSTTENRRSNENGGMFTSAGQSDLQNVDNDWEVSGMKLSSVKDRKALKQFLQGLKTTDNGITDDQRKLLIQVYLSIRKKEGTYTSWYSSLFRFMNFDNAAKIAAANALADSLFFRDMPVAENPSLAPAAKQGVLGSIMKLKKQP